MTELAFDAHGHRIQAICQGITQNKAYDASAVVDNAVSGVCQVAIVYCTTDAHFKQTNDGSTPAATTSDQPITAKVPMFVRTVPGKSKFAFIKQAGSSAGTGYVTEGGD